MLNQSDFDDAPKALLAGLIGRDLDLRESLGDRRSSTRCAAAVADLVAAGYIPLTDIAASLDATQTR